MPAASRERSGVEISGTVQLDPAGASGNLTVTARGIFNRYTEAAADSGKFIAGLLKKIFPVRQAGDQETARPDAGGKCASRRPSAARGSRRPAPVSSAPTPSVCPDLSENLVQLEKRETPLVLDAPFAVSVEPGAAAGRRPEARIRRPQRASARTRPGIFPAAWWSRKTACCGFPRALRIDKALIGPDKYPLLRELLLPYFAPDFWLVFKKEK